MSIEGLSPLVYEQMGGVQTLPDPLDVEVGKATEAKNVEFHLGTSVASRSGRSLFATVSGNPNIISMAEYALLDGATRRLLILGSDGSLWKENGDQSLTLIESGLGVTTRLAQATAFGRQYLAFSDGKLGSAPPRYYDDTHLYRVSQEGPGTSPDVSASSRTGGTVDAGLHFFRVVFELADGFRTAPGPAARYTALGGENIRVFHIPTGPSNVVRRIIIASAAVSADLAPTILPDGVSYFFIPNSTMVVNDNTSTEAIIDFSDLQLTAAEDVTDYLFRIVLPEQAGVITYNNRLVWWGGQNEQYHVADTGLLNMHFDGGYNFPNVFGKVPNGWVGKHQGCDVVSPVTGATGAVFRIVADGATQRGTIQNEVMGMDLNKLIRPNTEYGGRIRARRSPGLTAGSVSLYFLQSGSVVVGGGGGLTIPFSQLTTEWQDFTGSIYPATPATPVDLVLKISGGKGGDGFTEILAPAGEYIEIDFASIYPINQPYTPSLLYCSKPGQPGVYDENGFVNVSENDGQAIRACCVIRGHLYVWKENSLYAVSDNGDDPVNWTVENVAGQFGVGTPSINGITTGEGWSLGVARSGLYLFDGGFPQKISEEIQPTWDEIDWNLGHLIVIQVHAEQKQCFIQVPLTGAGQINRTLYLDWTGAAPASPDNRNWCPEWTTAASSMALSRRSDGTLAVLFGTCDGTGRILRLDGSIHHDAGAAFESFYRTAYGGGPSGRNSFQYVTASAKGSGRFTMYAVLPDTTTLKPLRTRDLQLISGQDIEWPGVRVNAERVAWEFGVNRPGEDQPENGFDPLEAWFSLRKLVPYARPAAWSRTRGGNAP